jgi:hypothetical protein
LSNIPAIAEAEDNLEQPYNAADEEQVAAARKKGGRNRRARLEFIQAMMELPEGRKWLWNILEKCFIFGNPVVQGDPHATYFNLGQQNIGKLILQDVQEFPELYVKAVAESKENR